MKFKKLVVCFLCTAVIGSGTFTYAAPSKSIVDSLKKQISSLQTQIKSFQQQITKKDASISDLQNKLANKDLDIKKLQIQLEEKDLTIKKLQSQLDEKNSSTSSNADNFEPLDIKYLFDGKEVQGQYLEGGTSVPQAAAYKGIIYSPLKLIAGSLERTVTYDEKLKTVYVDSKSKEEAMSDVLKPIYTEGMYAIFSKDTSSYMTISSKKYYSGFCMYPDLKDKQKQGSLTFNLEGKYKSIKGLIGLQDGSKDDKLKVDVYGNGTLLGRYEASAGSQPLNFDIDVKGVHLLEIKRIESGTVNLVDLVIK